MHPMTTSSASISNSRKIAIFYHVYQAPGWRSLVEEQINLLFSTDLANRAEVIYVGVNGNEPMDLPGDEFIVNFNSEPWTEETPTLVALKEFCAINPNWNVLYFHTKGITQNSQETADWRKAMEYFCIEQWSACIEKLNTNDAVGCLYMDDCFFGYFPHYSGNFWWAQSSYINRLDESFLDGGIRQNREFWIGTGGGSMFSFLTTGLNHYAVRFPRHLYESIK